MAGERNQKQSGDGRFYGRRKGHSLSPRQKALLKTVLPSLAIEIDLQRNQRVDVSALFSGNFETHWLEIGFGKGEHLVFQAKANQQTGIIGCDPFVNGVVSLLDRVEAEALENVRIYPDDARHLIARLPEACLERIFLIHPDPWPKKRHARRRFVNQKNLNELARIMADGAELRIGTDHADYASWVMREMAGRDDFSWMAENASDWRTPPADWPETRYASKALDEGIDCVYLRFVRAARK